EAGKAPLVIRQPGEQLGEELRVPGGILSIRHVWRWIASVGKTVAVAVRVQGIEHQPLLDHVGETVAIRVPSQCSERRDQYQPLLPRPGPQAHWGEGDRS